ncbi:MAG: hypothetical protein C0403_02150 [Desulfobacterium sp.]|nr:hypothetical protein [Desulfobacterium sp.]
MKQYKALIKLGLLVLVSLCILFFNIWSACSNQKSFEYIKTIGLYNHLADAFLAGQLYLLIDPLPELMALSDPFDPQKNKHLRLHDASLYNNKYYIYFGPAPVLTLYLPYQTLTGKRMSAQMATSLYFMGIFVVGTFFLYKIRQMLFPNSGFGILLIGVLSFGLLNPFGYLLRGTAIYEVAIASGCFWFLLSVYLLFCSVIKINTKGVTSWRAIELAFSTIFYGLAVASRPSYALSIIIFLIPLLQIWRTGSKTSERLKIVFSIGLPLCIIVSLLFLYNYLRFNNIFEFGLTYQLVDGPIAHRINRWNVFNVMYNAYLYFLLPIIPDYIFPFFHLTDQSYWNATPSYLNHIIQYYGPEPVMGIIPNIPIVLGIMLFLKFAITKNLKRDHRTIFLILLCLLLIPSVLNMTLLLFYSSASIRYLIDFLPYVLLLSIVGWSVYLEKISSNNFFYKVIVYFFYGMLFCWSIFVNTSISLTGYNNNFAKENKNLFEKIESYFTPISFLYYRYNLEKYGGINLLVQFPQKESGMETIAVVWPWTGEDVVLIHYRKKNEIMFSVYSQNKNQIFWSRPLVIDYSQTYVLNIHLGSLYPKPSQYLLSLGYNPEKYTKLEISLNNAVIINQKVEFQESHPQHVYVGKADSHIRTAYPWFSGNILYFQRLPLF